jgi:lipoprotein-releasing system permease protein
MNLVLDIAATHLRARLRQTLVAVAGVATGVGFSIMMAALMQGSQDDFIRNLVDALAHITVSDERRSPPPQPAEEIYAVAEIHGLRPETIREGIKNPLAIMAGLEAWIPGSFAPAVNSNSILRYAGRDVPAAIIGIDPKREPQVSSIAADMKAGSLSALYTAANAVVLGDRLAEKLGARLGATLSVTTPSGTQVVATVVGLFRTGVRAVDEGRAYVLMKTAQVLENRTGLVNEIRIRLNDPLQAAAVARRIETQTGYKSVAWTEANEDLLAALQIRNVIMYTVVGAILLVASFGIYNVISTITHEKTRDIAILKALGLTEAVLRRIFLLEALAIGLAGSLVGWALGFLLCLVLGSIEFKVAEITDMERLPLAYAPLHYAVASGVALTSSFLAGFLPARKAARAHPVETIRGAI